MSYVSITFPLSQLNSSSCSCLRSINHNDDHKRSFRDPASLRKRMIMFVQLSNDLPRFATARVHHNRRHCYLIGVFVKFYKPLIHSLAKLIEALSQIMLTLTSNILCIFQILDSTEKTPKASSHSSDRLFHE